MRTLTLIRLALLVFILCLAGYNQSVEKSGMEIESARNTRQTELSLTSSACQKISLLFQKQSSENGTARFKDY